jgi:hypothetical protein
MVDVPDRAVEDVVKSLRRRGLQPMVKDLTLSRVQIPRGNQVLAALEIPFARTAYAYKNGEEFALLRLEETVMVVEYKNGQFTMFSVGWETFKNAINIRRSWVKGAIRMLRERLNSENILKVETYEEAIAWCGWPWREALMVKK